MDEFQEVEITIRGKVKMPTAEGLLKMYKSADVLEAVVEDWTLDENLILENVEEWILVSAEKVSPASEPSLIEHVKKTL